MSRTTQNALLKQLKDPFDSKFVKWRVGTTKKDKSAGLALAYLDAREVMKRLDDVCGVGGWQSKYTEIKDGYICELSLLIDGQWITKSDAADYTDIEAVKGGASSALKRAAAVWGVGRYLYYLPNVWAPLRQQGTNSKGEPNYVLAEIPELPEWAKPNPHIERWEDVAEMELELAQEIEPEANEDRIKAIAEAYNE